MKKLIVVLAAVGVGLSGVAAAVPASAAPAAPPGPAWAPCTDPGLGGLECATLKVPLNHSRPWGRKINIALSRIKATAPADKYQGIVLVNRGGPGGTGRDFVRRFPLRLPADVASTYDWIGFDPRGVGASEPISCDENYSMPVRPDYITRTRTEEQVWLDRTKEYVAQCQAKHGWLLPYMTTRDVARDMDAIRVALGQRQINYYGYSYGTYLGTTYGTLFPKNVRRMVLDSVVNPKNVWYDANVDQDYAFDKNAKIYFAWVAKHDSAYHLGTTAAAVEKNYYAVRDDLAKNPVPGIVGPDELEDIYINVGYNSLNWAPLTPPLAAYVAGDKQPMIDMMRDSFGPGDNSYAVYNAVQCSDVQWPKRFSKWRSDAWKIYQTAPFLVWNNTWFNAPCLFWPVSGGETPKVSGKGLPGVLIFQPGEDAATVPAGAFEVHRLMKNSRLVLAPGDPSHGLSLSGNVSECANDWSAKYLRDGTLPPSRRGADALCTARPEPVPDVAAASRSAKAGASIPSWDTIGR